MTTPDTSRLRKVKLWLGPMDGYIYGVEEVDGELPSSLDIVVPSPVPDHPMPDGPFPKTAPNIATYDRTHTHPSHGLLPVYRIRAER